MNEFDLLYIYCLDLYWYPYLCSWLCCFWIIFSIWM